MLEGQSLLPWSSLALCLSPSPHTICGKRAMKSACSFSLGAACFAYQRQGHFFYCYTSLLDQVFLQKTEREREGGGRLMRFWESEHTKQLGLPEFGS